MAVVCTVPIAGSYGGYIPAEVVVPLTGAAAEKFGCIFAGMQAADSTIREPADALLAIIAAATPEV